MEHETKTPRPEPDLEAQVAAAREAAEIIMEGFRRLSTAMHQAIEAWANAVREFEISDLRRGSRGPK